MVKNNYFLFGIKNTTASPNRGTHGFNNTLPSMRGVFFAHGPSFKKDKKINSFRNVNIYPLLCKLIEIKPNPNNGSLSPFFDAFVESTNKIKADTKM